MLPARLATALPPIFPVHPVLTPVDGLLLIRYAVPRFPLWYITIDTHVYPVFLSLAPSPSCKKGL